MGRNLWETYPQVLKVLWALDGVRKIFKALENHKNVSKKNLAPKEEVKHFLQNFVNLGKPPGPHKKIPKKFLKFAKLESKTKTDWREKNKNYGKISLKTYPQTHKVL